MAKCHEFHLAVSSAAARQLARLQTINSLQSAHMYTGFIQQSLVKPPIGKLSHAMTIKQGAFESHHHMYILETHKIQMPEF